MTESSSTKETTLGTALGSVTVTESEAAVFIEALARALPLVHESLRTKMFDGANKLAYAPAASSKEESEPAHTRAQRVA